MAAVAAALVVIALGANAWRTWSRPDTPGTVVQPHVPALTGLVPTVGVDVSYPQCRTTLPSGTSGFVIVGLHKGKPFVRNNCVGKLWKWAITHEAVAAYINMADPSKGSAAAYGEAIADDALRILARIKAPADTPVWLDIESSNTWSGSARSMRVITATMAKLTAAGHPVGIYAAPGHWFEITLDAPLDVPVWLALGQMSTVEQGQAEAQAACKRVAFGGKAPAIVQFTVDHLDRNVLCGSATGLVTRP